MALMGLMELPPELLQRICSFFELAERSSKDDLWNISLTCRYLRDTISPFLFKDITLRLRWVEGALVEPALYRLSQRCPELLRYARQLHICADSQNVEQPESWGEIPSQKLGPPLPLIDRTQLPPAPPQPLQNSFVTTAPPIYLRQPTPPPAIYQLPKGVSSEAEVETRWKAYLLRLEKARRLPIFKVPVDILKACALLRDQSWKPQPAQPEVTAADAPTDGFHECLVGTSSWVLQRQLEVQAAMRHMRTARKDQVIEVHKYFATHKLDSSNDASCMPVVDCGVFDSFLDPSFARRWSATQSDAFTLVVLCLPRNIAAVSIAAQHAVGDDQAYEKHFLSHTAAAALSICGERLRKLAMAVRPCIWANQPLDSGEGYSDPCNSQLISKLTVIDYLALDGVSVRRKPSIGSKPDLLLLEYLNRWHSVSNTLNRLELSNCAFTSEYMIRFICGFPSLTRLRLFKIHLRAAGPSPHRPRKAVLWVQAIAGIRRVLPQLVLEMSWLNATCSPLSTGAFKYLMDNLVLAPHPVDVIAEHSMIAECCQLHKTWNSQDKERLGAAQDEHRNRYLARHPEIRDQLWAPHIQYSRRKYRVPKVPTWRWHAWSQEEWTDKGWYNYEAPPELVPVQPPFCEDIWRPGYPRRVRMQNADSTWPWWWASTPAVKQWGSPEWTDHVS